jgi:hypothetical protein
MGNLQSFAHFAAIRAAALGEVALSTPAAANNLTSPLEEVVHIVSQLSRASKEELGLPPSRSQQGYTSF